jgi:AcrR family transcriptional regulator
VLDAAAEAFAEHGPDVSVDEIARRAGVGNATVFRRFPTKQALIAAVLDGRLAELLALAEEALAEEDAGAAFDGFVWRVAEVQMRDRGLYQCLDRCLGSPATAELEAAAARVVERAQAAGALRLDVTTADVSALVGAALRAAAGDEWRRYIAVVLDGLKPS